MTLSRRQIASIALGVTFISLIAMVGPIATALAARPAPLTVPGPTISLDTTLDTTPGTFTVSGAGFTPGGKVDVDVFILDQGGLWHQQSTAVTTSRTHSLAGY